MGQKRPWEGTDLPPVIPVFPLDGALLLPRGRLPLNIFEPRYLEMVADALSGAGTGAGAGAGMIGMIQPRDPATYVRAANAEIYDIGCLGRIIEHTDTDDGRVLIVLEGVARFRVLRELEAPAGYRRVAVSYGDYATDLAPAPDLLAERLVLIRDLRSFFDRMGIETDWAAVETTPDETLVNSIAMMCPFSGVEKQALLEAASLTERASVLTALMAFDAPAGEARKPH